MRDEREDAVELFGGLAHAETHEAEAAALVEDDDDNIGNRIDDDPQYA